jgi:hypothetical protein
MIVHNGYNMAGERKRVVHTNLYEADMRCCFDLFIASFRLFLRIAVLGRCCLAKRGFPSASIVPIALPHIHRQMLEKARTILIISVQKHCSVVI